MSKLRNQVERSLRASGLFIPAKRALYATQTRAWKAAVLGRRVLGQGNMPKGRVGQVMLFHTARCGSTVLGNQLNDHPAIHWDSEIYNYPWRGWTQRGASGGTQHTRQAEAILATRMAFPKTAWYGCEVNPTQLRSVGIDPAGYAQRVEAMGVDRFIVLRRENLLRKIISGEVAKARGQYHASNGQATKTCRITLDVDRLVMGETMSLVEQLDRFSQAYRDLENSLSGKRVLHLSYEADIASDPRQAYRKVCGFLEIEPVDGEVSLRKTTAQPLPELLENMEAVRRVLSGTAYAWMLEDGPAPYEQILPEATPMPKSEDDDEVKRSA